MNPNLAIFSLRGLSTHVSRCLGYEFEDLLCSALPGTTLYAPQLSPSMQTALKIKARIAQTGSFGGIFDNVLAVEEVDEHEVLLAVIGGVRDLALLDALKGWRRKSRYAICRLDEFWVKDVPRLRRFIRLLEQFDLVYCSEYHIAETLREGLVNADVMYLPPGVDTLALAPDLEPSLRPIDVTNLGSLADATHKGLLEYAKQTDGFYFFDTLKGRFEARTPSEHRFRYANILKRTKYFLCHFAFMRSAEIPKQIEFGPRYSEGIAAGCVILGSWKSTPAFEQYLGWEDAVIEMPFEDPNPSELLRFLDSQADRLREISLRNVRHALQAHDHVHLWSAVVDKLGLPEAYRMRRREEEVARKLSGFGYSVEHSAREVRTS